MEPRILAGPVAAAGPEPLADHAARLGRVPRGRDAATVIPVLESSGLLGRGGAGFPVGRKWRSVAGQPGGRPIVLVNGAEGEPLSAKDRTLLRLRPHLVIDGALLAADAVNADRIVFYVGSAHRDARTSLGRALAERRDLRPAVDLVKAPDAYVAGEESAAVQFVNVHDARPTVTPPRPYERGIAGRPTLVQNVESLAMAALIARHGDAWYRERGRDQTPGSALLTISGSSADGVREVEIGTTIGEIAASSGAGSRPDDRQAVLLGGYFGGWLSSDRSWDLPLDPLPLREAGSAFGAGVVAFLGNDRCGVRAPRDRRRDGPPGGKPAGAGRSRADRALVASAGGARRVPSPGRRRRPPPELAPGLRPGMGAPPAPPAVLARAAGGRASAEGGLRWR
jgi:NADH:ubiquinone oxidoreductase subunit F (NADH-binding)